ncbi:MAG: hypothetical protein K0S57_2913 [Ramlibacter sp.]|nr:hypothetical protein [Ramlibacter sp.]
MVALLNPPRLPLLLTKALLALCCVATAPAALANGPTRKSGQAQARKAAPPAPAVARDGEAEARLIEIYKLIGQAQTRTALGRAEALVRDHPNFSLAQLVYGDLLMAQLRPVRAFGDVPEQHAQGGGQVLAELREESLLRMRALRERPRTAPRG